MLTIKRIRKAAQRTVGRAWLNFRAATGATKQFWCPACETPIIGFFTYSGPNWGCPNCGASPRERFVKACLCRDLLRVPATGCVLHMAPSEASLVRHFSAVGKVTFADISPSRYPDRNVLRLDLMAMDGLGKFDVFYASHVMEHVPDDSRVLRNVYDHLRPGGQAWILVPLHDGPTIEGWPGMSASEREKQFGQWDHARQYGIDLAGKMREIGFSVNIIAPSQIPGTERVRFGLRDSDKIFVAVRNYEERLPS